MLLAHPEVATRSCEECAKWSYRPDGTIAKDRKGDPIPLGRGKTPCALCPKKNPIEAPQYEINERNLLAVRAYYQVQATGGACLNEREKRDPILLRNLATIDRVIKSFERSRSTSVMSETIGASLKNAITSSITSGIRR